MVHLKVMFVKDNSLNDVSSVPWPFMVMHSIVWKRDPEQL